jgi:hypothetical protein
MTAEALLNRLTALDVDLKTSDQQLSYDAPSDVMTLELLEEMKEHKEELILILAGDQPRSAEPSAPEMAKEVFDGELLPEAREGVEVPAAFLLAGPTADLHGDLTKAGDDVELEHICSRINDAYKAGAMQKNTLKALTDAVSLRSVYLQRREEARLKVS